jgi:ankyrin repeat protein
MEKNFGVVFFTIFLLFFSSCLFAQKELELLQSAEKGDSASVVELLKSGANPNTAYEDGQTALMLACRGNFSNIARELVEYGALINTHSVYNHSALLYSVGRGNLELTRFLVSKGADLNIDGPQAMIFAANRSHFEVLRYLVEDQKLNVSAQTDDGNYSLIGAVIGGNLDIVKYLVKNGANLNLKNDTKTADYKNLSLYGTPLIHAVTSDKFSIVRYLIDTGANVNIKTNSGYSALMLAIMFNKFETARYLIDKGADMNDQDANGYTVLMHAAIQVKFDLVKHLVEKGADVNRANAKGKTILDVLEIQADIQNKFGDTDVYKMTKKIMSYLKDHGAKYSGK